MSPPRDHATNGSHHDPLSPLRQLRAVLSSGSSPPAPAGGDDSPATVDTRSGSPAADGGGRDDSWAPGPATGTDGNAAAPGGGDEVGLSGRPVTGGHVPGALGGQRNGVQPAPGEGRGRRPSPPSTVLTADDVLALGDTPAGDTGTAEADVPDSGQRGGGSPLLPVRHGVPDDRRDEAGGDEDVAAPITRPRRLRDRTYQRRFGVAPFVRPSARRSRRRRRRDYRKLGFIELTQEKMRLRHRILPRTVIGISLMILALGVGAAFAGATLYAYYDYRQTQNETKVEAFAKGFENQYTSAVGQVQGVRDQAVKSVNDALGPLQEWKDDANAVVELPSKVGGGVWTLRSSDTAGRPVIGSAFVVSSDATGSLLLTAYETVGAATAQPGPKVTLEKNGEQLSADVWSWDAEHDLALLKVAKGGLPVLAWAPESVRSAVRGDRVYAVSGLGGAGAKAVGGMVVDQSAAGIQHNIPLSADFNGGPIVTADGHVLAVATATYRPLGFDPGPLPYAPDVTMSCTNQKVLVCPAALTGPTGAGQPGR